MEKQKKKQLEKVSKFCLILVYEKVVIPEQLIERMSKKIGYKQIYRISFCCKIIFI